MKKDVSKQPANRQTHEDVDNLFEFIGFQRYGYYSN